MRYRVLRIGPYSPWPAAAYQFRAPTGEDGSVCRGESGTVDLSLKDVYLVAEGEDLRVAFVAGHHKQSETSDQESEQVRNDR